MLLGKEFMFKPLTEACAAFTASKELVCVSLTNTGVSDWASDFVDVSRVWRPRVTITVGGYCRTYEALKSVDDINAFVGDLVETEEHCIEIEGIKETKCPLDDAVKTVYSNTVANFPVDYRKNPFLALVLWIVHRRLFSCGINALISCLNLLPERTPTAFEKALLLLLSQCDTSRYGEFVPLPKADWCVITSAVKALEQEDNGQRREVTELLEILRSSGKRNNNTFTWSGPSGVLGCTGQRPERPAAGWCKSSTQ
jgi:hypothetical protein